MFNINISLTEVFTILVINQCFQLTLGWCIFVYVYLFITYVYAIIFLKITVNFVIFMLNIFKLRIRIIIKLSCFDFVLFSFKI